MGSHSHKKNGSQVPELPDEIFQLKISDFLKGTKNIALYF